MTIRSLQELCFPFGCNWAVGVGVGVCVCGGGGGVHVRMCLNATCNTMQLRIGSDACHRADVALRPLDVRPGLENSTLQRRYLAD